MIGLPGYYVSNGVADKIIHDNYDRGMDWRLYWIYIFTMFSSTYGLLLGNLISKEKVVVLRKRKKSSLLLYFSLIVCFIYTAIFFSWIPIIPIMGVFDSVSLVEMAMNRLKVTHGFVDLNPPFLFRYWRNVLQYFLPFIFLVFLSRRIMSGRKIFSPSMLTFFVIVCFCLAFTLEKASLIYFFISIFIVYSVTRVGRFYNPIGFKYIFTGKLLLFSSVSVLGLILMYETFMSGGGVESASSRIMRQTASNYLQITFFDEHGKYGLAGLNSRILGFFGSSSGELDYSKMAIQKIYPQLHDGGLSGAAGGMFGTNIIFIFGYWGSILIFFYMVALGAMDKLFSNIAFGKTNFQAGCFLVSFYAVFCSWYAMRALSNPLSIFSFDFIVNPSLLLLLSFLFVFVYFGATKKY